MAVEKRIGEIQAMVVIQSETTNINEEDLHFQEIAKDEESSSGRSE